jgi:hypothetical protein
MTTQAQITCKCGKQMYWLAENTFTKEPCPSCGRRYVGKYNRKTLQIDAVEIKKPGGFFHFIKATINRIAMKKKRSCNEANYF